jgi:hypothetical protein
MRMGRTINVSSVDGDLEHVENLPPGAHSHVSRALSSMFTSHPDTDPAGHIHSHQPASVLVFPAWIVTEGHKHPFCISGRSPTPTGMLNVSVHYL